MSSTQYPQGPSVVEDSADSQPETQETQETQAPGTTATAGLLPALPDPAAVDSAVKLDMSSGSAEAKLDDLGPLVVNVDGTVSRINNWAAMADVEKANTLRILGARNKMRLAKLKKEKGLE